MEKDKLNDEFWGKGVMGREKRVINLINIIDKEYAWHRHPKMSHGEIEIVRLVFDAATKEITRKRTFCCLSMSHQISPLHGPI